MQFSSVLNQNLTLSLNNVNQNIGLIFYDPISQDAMLRISKNNEDITTKNVMIKSFTNLLFFSNSISSIFVFDDFGNIYSNYSGKYGNLYVNSDMKDITKASWYKEAIRLNGIPLWMKGSGGVLHSVNPNDGGYISLIKVINSTNNLKKISVLIVTLDINSLRERCIGNANKNDYQFLVVGKDGDYIMVPKNYDKSILDSIIKGQLNKRTSYSTVTINGQKNIVAGESTTFNDWRIIGFTPVNVKPFMNAGNIKNYVMPVLFNIGIILIGSFFISRAVVNPITGLKKYMQMAEDGHLVPVPVDMNRKDEITQLKRVFNKMIASIDQLIYQIKDEEKTIRRNEFELIQSQINPHFLYNTLDAISSLSLIGDYKNTLKITKALGMFYRISLSSGRDCITVKEEINCIKNYIKIMNIRFDNQIDDEYDIQEDIQDMIILKLILQPIVENAIHHGIRNIKGRGKIRLVGYLDEDELVFMVSDNGEGMSDERIHEILSGNKKSTNHSFGLYSCSQRIFIFYGINNPISIVSEEGSGTEVTIRVKVLNNGGILL